MTQIADLVTYVTFDLNQIPPEINKSSDLKTYILLQTQGESVELIEDSRISLSMFVFNILHTVCPEVVFSAKDGSKFIIYEHHTEPVFHALGINEALSIKKDFNVMDETPEDLTINLEEIWNSISENKYENKILQTMEIVKTKITRTTKTTIIGNVPLLVILCTQHLIGNNSKQLFYRRSTDSEAKRIK